MRPSNGPDGGVVSSDRVSPTHLQRSLRNSWFSGWTQALGLGASFVLSVLLARLAGVEELGLYSFAGGLASLLVGLTSFAINIVVAREVARQPTRAAQWLIDGMNFGVGVSLPMALLAAAGCAWALGLDASTWWVVVLFALLQAVRNARGVIFGVLQGLSRFDRVTTAEGLTQLVTLVAAALVLWQGAGIAALVGCLLVVEIILVFGLGRHVLTRLSRPTWRLAPDIWRDLAVHGFPIALIGLAQAVNVRADVVMLGLWGGRFDVGLFTAALAPYFAAVTFLSAVTFGFFPSLSSLHHRATAEFDWLTRRTATWLASSSTALAVGLTLGARPAMLFVYGSQFEAAVGPLEILCIAIPLSAVGRLLGICLTSMGRQQLALYAAASGALVHVMANLFMIPAYGPRGAAAALVAGESVMLLHAVWLFMRSRTSSVRTGAVRPVPAAEST